MMKKILAVTVVMFHIFTTAVPVSFAAIDGVTVDSQEIPASFQNGNTTTITVPGGQAYHLPSLDIAPEQTVNVSVLNAEGIADPSAKAILEITSGVSSLWEGTLNVMGTVAFINTAGFNLTESFQGNVQGGVILSSLDINRSAFFQGLAELAREVSRNPALVSNKGNFNLAEKSFLALVGSAARNQGNVAANGGAVVLAAGDKVTLSLGSGDGLISVTVEKPVEAPVYDFQGNKISDAVSNSGKIKTDGGIAILSAKAAEGIFDHVVNHTGIIEANTIKEVNGRIILDGGDSGIVQVAGELNAKGDDEGEKGGVVEVLGDKVGLYGETRADVSGYKGGGTLLVGGDYQGLGTTHRASYTYVDPNASLKADALLEGDGGKIIVWGNQGTRAHGQLSARGGVLGGNGGLIETSGKSFLDITGIRVDASASNGKAGLWALDPENTDVDNVVTSGGSFSGVNPNVFAPTADNAIVNIADIQFSLNNGTDVTITTVGSGGGQLGDVRVKNKIEKTAGGNAIFKILSAHDIELEIPASIVSTAGALGIFFEAANQIIIRNFLTTNGGDVTLNAVNGIRLAEAEADIKTGGGAFNANANTNNDDDGTFFTNGASAISGGAAITTDAGVLNITGRRAEIGGSLKSTTGKITVAAERGFITIDNLIQTSGGEVVLNAKDGIDLNSEFADIRTSGGAVTANANTDLDALGEFNQNDAGDVINSGAGKISLQGRQVGITGTLRSTTGDVELKALQGAVSLHNSIATTGGAVNLQATIGITLDNVNSDITTAGGKLTANADSDANGTGLFNQSNVGSVINTSAGDLEISGDSATTAGALRSTTGNIKVTSTGGPVTVSNTITTGGGNVTLNGANGINLDNVNSDILTAGGALTADADADASHTGDFIQSHAGSVVSTSGGKVSVSGDKVDLNGTLRSGLGDMALTSTGGFVSVAGTLETLGGKMDINGANGINLDGPTDIRTTGAAFTANADSDANGTGTFFQSDALSVVNTAGGKVSVSGDKVDLNGTLRSGLGDMALTSTGGFVSVAGTLETLGGKMDINGANGINLDGPTDIRTTGAAFTANADSDANGTGTFFQSDPLSVVNTAGGKLSVSGDKVDLNGTLRSGLGDMALTSTGGFVSVAGTLETLGGKMDINGANGINLDGPTDIRTTGGEFAGNADSDANGTGTFVQSDLLSSVNTTGGKLTASGDKMNLDGIFKSGLGNMLLSATGGLLSIAGTLETLGGSLTVNSANGISLDGPTDIRTTGGKFEANADEDANATGEFLQSDILSSVSSGAGDLSISAQRMDLDGILKTTTGNVDLLATGGFVNVHTIQTQGADIHLNATNGVSVDGAGIVDTKGGVFSADANTDNNGSGAFTQTDALSVITTSGGELTGRGVSADLQGTLKSGTGNVALTATHTTLGTGKEIETQGGYVELLAKDGMTLTGTSIRTNGGYFNANANSNNDSIGSFSHTDPLGSILTSGGSLGISGTSISSEGTMKSGAGNLALTATHTTLGIGKEIETQGGNVDLIARDGMTLTGTSVRTNGGYFNAVANSDNNNSGSFTHTDPLGSIQTSGGQLDINGTAVSSEGTMKSGIGNILINATRTTLGIGKEIETQGGNVDLIARDGMTLTGTSVRTNGGYFKANANADNSNSGSFSHTDPLGSIQTSGGLIEITGTAASSEGTIKSGGAGIAITGTLGAVSLGKEIETSGGKVDLLAGDGITLTDTKIRTLGGAFTANANTDGDDPGSFTQTGATGLINTQSLTTAGGDMTISGRGVGIEGSLIAGDGDIKIEGTHTTVTLGNEVTTLGGKVDIKAAEGFTLDGADADIRSNGGNISINANTDLDADGSYKETNGGTLVDTGGGSLTITANDFGMNGTHQAVGNKVSLLTNKPGIPIHLGFALHTNNEANIKDGESDRIFANTLEIGSANAGDFLVGKYSPANVNTLVLTTGGKVVEEAPDNLADIVVPDLAIHSQSGVNVDVDVNNIAIQNDNFGAVNVEDMAGGMAVGTVAGFTGVKTNGGGITLLTHSPLIVNSPVLDSGGGDITLAALGNSLSDDLALHANVTASGGNGNIQLVAGDTLTIDDGIIVSAANKGSVTAAAGEDFTDGLYNQNGNPLGDLVMGPSAALQSEDGDIKADAAHDIFLGVLNANSDNDKDSGNVITFSRTGKTTDSNLEAVNIIAKNLTMLSFGDIGTKKDPIELGKGVKINKPEKSSFPQCSGGGKCDSDRYTKSKKG